MKFGQWGSIRDVAVGDRWSPQHFREQQCRIGQPFRDGQVDFAASDEGAEKLAGGDLLIKEGFRAGESGLAEAGGFVGMVEDPGEGGCEGVGIFFRREQAGLAIDDHFGHAGEVGGDAGQGGGHGFHEHGRQVVHSAIVLGGAGQREDGGFVEAVDDPGHGFGAGEAHDAFETGGLDAGGEIRLEFPRAGDLALEDASLFFQDGTGGDQIGEAFFRGQATDGQDEGRVDFFPGTDAAEDGVQIESIIHPLDFATATMGLAEVAGGEVAHGDHDGGVVDEILPRDLEGIGAEDIIGVAGEAVGGPVEFAQPPAGPGGEAGEVGVGVAHAGGGEFVSDPGGFMHAAFVGFLTPVAEGQDGFLRQEVGLFEGFDFLDEGFSLGKSDHIAEQFRGEVADILVGGIVDGEQQRMDALAAQFHHLAGAERLRERGKTLENVGERRAHGAGSRVRGRGRRRGLPVWWRAHCRP